MRHKCDFCGTKLSPKSPICEGCGAKNPYYEAPAQHSTPNQTYQIYPTDQTSQTTQPYQTNQTGATSSTYQTSQPQKTTQASGKKNMLGGSFAIIMIGVMGFLFVTVIFPIGSVISNLRDAFVGVGSRYITSSSTYEDYDDDDYEYEYEDYEYSDDYENQKNYHDLSDETIAEIMDSELSEKDIKTAELLEEQGIYEPDVVSKFIGYFYPDYEEISVSDADEGVIRVVLDNSISLEYTVDTESYEDASIYSLWEVKPSFWCVYWMYEADDEIYR